MKFSISLGTDHVGHQDATSSGGISAVARAVEANGLDAVFVTDHPAPDTRWLAGGGHHALEPTVALTVAAAATTTLRLHTHIYVLALRNPFLAAKALGSLSIVSGGRLICGVAAGYLRPEFSAAGVPFAERNRRTDDAIAILRRLWAGEVVAGEQDGWKATGVQTAPVAPPSPIWIGGNSSGAMRRAAQLGDGWAPFPTMGVPTAATKTTELTEVTTLAEQIARLQDWRAEAGSAGPFDVCCGAFSLAGWRSGTVSDAQLLDELGTMGRAGVTWTTVDVGGTSSAESVDRIGRFASRVAQQL